MQTDWTGADAPKPWTLADIYADLCGTEDVAAILDVKKYRVRKWIQRAERIGCPKPVRTIGGYHIYSAEEWRGWFARFQAKHRPNTKWTDDALGFLQTKEQQR